MLIADESAMVEEFEEPFIDLLRSHRTYRPGMRVIFLRYQPLKATNFGLFTLAFSTKVNASFVEIKINGGNYFFIFAAFVIKNANFQIPVVSLKFFKTFDQLGDLQNTTHPANRPTKAPMINTDGLLFTESTNASQYSFMIFPLINVCI